VSGKCKSFCVDEKFISLYINRFIYFYSLLNETYECINHLFFVVKLLANMAEI